jgi:hypothetical protein
VTDIIEPDDDAEDEVFDYDEDEDGDAETMSVTTDTLYEYLAEVRNDFELANPTCDEDDVPLVRTETICADLGIDVPTFHNLKTRLQRKLAGGEVTMMGINLKPAKGGWGWKLLGNGASAVARWHTIARQKNILGRARSSHAIAQSTARYAKSGATLVPNDPVASQALARRLEDQEIAFQRLAQDAERLLVALMT